MHRSLGVCVCMFVRAGVCNCDMPVVKKTLWLLSYVSLGVTTAPKAETSCLINLLPSSVSNFSVDVSIGGSVFNLQCSVSQFPTYFYATKDVTTREIIDHRVKFLQTMFLLAAHTPMASRLWTLFSSPND